MDLHRCIPLLNLIDCELEKIIEGGKDFFFLSSELNTAAVVNTEKSTEVSANEIQDARELMLFSIHLLRNSTNKDVFNSTEVRIDSCNDMQVKKI